MCKTRVFSLMRRWWRNWTAHHSREVPCVCSCLCLTLWTVAALFFFPDEVITCQASLMCLLLLERLSRFHRETDCQLCADFCFCALFYFLTYFFYFWYSIIYRWTGIYIKKGFWARKPDCVTSLSFGVHFVFQFFCQLSEMVLHPIWSHFAFSLLLWSIFFSCFVVMCEFFVYFYDNSTFFVDVLSLICSHLTYLVGVFLFACLFCDFTPRSL